MPPGERRSLRVDEQRAHSVLESELYFGRATAIEEGGARSEESGARSIESLAAQAWRPFRQHGLRGNLRGIAQRGTPETAETEGGVSQAAIRGHVSSVSVACFGCGDLTKRRYRDLPLCLDCQREAALLNQLDALPAEMPRDPEMDAIEAALRRPARRLTEFAAMAACVFMLWVFLYLTRDFWIEWARMWGILK